jgi:hypothetical protein
MRRTESGERYGAPPCLHKNAADKIERVVINALELVANVVTPAILAIAFSRSR